MADDIVASSRDAIITIEPGGRVTSFNPGAEAIFGLQASEVISKTVAEVFLPLEGLDDFTDCVLEAVRHPDQEHIANISLANTSQANISPERERDVLHLSVRTVLLRRKDTGERTGVLVMISDESERVELLARNVKRESERAATGRFIVAILTIFSVFTLLLEPIQKLAREQSFDYGPVMALLTLVILAFMINRWISPSSQRVGLNLRPKRRHVIEAITWSIGFCAATTVAKYAWISIGTGANNPQATLFSFYVLDDGTKVESVGLYAIGVSVYLVSVLFQQFATRCAIQAPLESFLTGVVGPAA